MRYRKKPIVIDAVQYSDSFGRAYNWEGAAREVLAFCPAYWDASGEFVVDTLEGTMKITRGDWIIQGVEGEFYPCKDSIFRATYEEIGDGKPGQND